MFFVTTSLDLARGRRHCALSRLLAAAEDAEATLVWVRPLALQLREACVTDAIADRDYLTCISDRQAAGLPFVDFLQRKLARFSDERSAQKVPAPANM